jgi:putative nucleotidyltransferase with HDIG domain
MMLDKEKVQVAEFLTELVGLAEKRGIYFQEHAARVTGFAEAIAREMKMNEEEMELLKTAATLHDIGVVAVSDMIINKNGLLSDEEMEIIKIHPIVGSRLVASVASLKECAPIIRHHHERSDGKGYPDGLDEESLTLPMKILITAEAYEAMISNRPYRPALPAKEVMEQLRVNSGTQFSPPVVNALMRIIGGKK